MSASVDPALQPPIEPAVTPDPRMPQPIRARALRTTFHFWKFALIAVAVFAYGGLNFLYDGLVAYPRMNARYVDLGKQIDERVAARVADDDAELTRLRKERKELKFRDGFDLKLQVVIGAICAPLGLGLLFWHLRNVRGSYLLEQDVLTLPNRKQVPLASIKSADTKKWWNKGLAFYTYQLDAGPAGKFRLDALSYEAKPSDAIAYAIADKLGQPIAAKPVPATVSEASADTTPVT